MKPLITTLVTLAICSSAQARFARPTDVPIDRLVTNQSTYLAKNPKDMDAVYTLARIHYLAFINDVTALSTYPDHKTKAYRLAHWQNLQNASINAEADRLALLEHKLDKVPLWNEPLGKEFQKTKQTQLKELRLNKWQPKKKSPEKALSHYHSSAALFEKVIAQSKSPALPTLGLASLQEQYAEPEMQKQFEAIKTSPAATQAEIITLYYKAFSLAVEQDTEKTRLPLLGLKSLISYEAGKAYIRLAPKGEHVNKVQQHLEKLEKLPRGPITPMVVDLSGLRSSISQVIDTTKSVDFDLTGLGRKGSYSWPHKDVGFFVWDPQATGNILDGKQLFGVYSWGIFWQDGFRAMAALDNNHDGQLSGEELKGIAVWVDANQNGISEPGEVQSVKAHNMVSIMVNAPNDDAGHPHQPIGVTLVSSKSLAVWDWMAKPKK